MNILVVNVGSSSLKLRVLDDQDAVVAQRDLPPVAAADLTGALGSFLQVSPSIDAVGHRVVHGGSAFTRPVRLDSALDATLDTLADLAPLHNPPSLAAVHAMSALLPAVDQVACFDTAFHADMPPRAATYAVPKTWREQWGVRRFGFHGLSHAWASRRAGELLDRPRERLRLVTAHLGSGASLAAVAFGRSVDTTMGFTPLDGLVMNTRSGSVDPGVLVWMQRRAGLSVEDVELALEHDSGLAGLWGGPPDIRRVIAAADAGDPEARVAYDVYVYRIQTSVAAMTAALGGLDGLVFTGGVGETSARVRGDTCAGLGFLGVQIDQDANRGANRDALVSRGETEPAVLVVTAREDLEIARLVREVLA